MSCVLIYLFNTLVINNMRREIRIDGSRYQFHLLHSKITPNAHPPTAPKRPEPSPHLRFLLLAGVEPAFGLPGFGIREDVRAAVERVGLGTYAHAGR